MKDYRKFLTMNEWEENYYYAQDWLVWEEQRLLSSIRNSRCSKNLRNLFEYRLFANLQLQEELMKNVQNGNFLPPYLVAETLGAFYEKASEDCKVMNLKQRYADMADYMLSIFSEFKQYAV